MQFYRLAPGARFEFRGKRYMKTAASMANDADRIGSVFLGETEVTMVGEPMLLPEAEAGKWKPSNTHWTEHLAPAPGQK